MSRPSGGTVHVGKAAAIIVVALVLGVIVLRDNGFGGGSISSAAVRDAIEDSFTETTVASNEENTTRTTVGALRAPATIKVIAINATGQAGKAGQATARLQQAGYNALQPGNATRAVTNSRPASVVYVVTPGFEREAETVAALFGLPASAVRALPNPSPSPDITSNANIAVLVGSGITL